MTLPPLDAIDSPESIKQTLASELPALADQLRKHIIEVLSVTGGHLASNLGAVELTLAMHWVFNSPKDKFIFDTSHQSYTHKLLTGRYKDFPSIRQFKGLCGFTNPQESEHDHFHAGHAGTALSLALGCAKERDLLKRDEMVVPVIGDAAFTCGLTLEALNNVPKNLRHFLVILNDNAMAISKNVGAITHILSRLINNPQSNRFYKNIDSLVSRIPHVGKALAEQSHKITGSLKNLVSPAAFFEQFGLSYVGPIDGHDIERLVHTLQALKNEPQPTILHVLTNKGQGMPEAQANPTPYHGVKSFDPDTGKFLPSKPSKPTFPKVFGKHLLNLMKKDPAIVVVNPAMTAGSCIDPVMEAFPERTIDVGIAEGHCVTYSGALAKNQGLKVICNVYSTFLQRAIDNVFHDVCLQESPVVFCLDRSGIATGDGVTHHGIYDIGLLNCMPNIVLCQPRNGRLLKELLESAFQYKRPTVIRYPNISCDEEQEKALEPRKLGKAEVVASGKGLLIVALGHMVDIALKLRQRIMDKYGIEATIVDPVFIKPLDTDLICQLLHTHNQIVTLEEHSIQCGLGSILNHYLVSKGFVDFPVLNFGLPETFFHQGGYDETMDELGLSEDKIFKKMEMELAFKQTSQV